MNDEQIRRLALVLAIHGYRNSPIEDIHADDRISQAEMKHLNKTIHNQIYTLLTLWNEGKLLSHWYFANQSWGSDWDRAELLPWEKHMREDDEQG